MDDRETYLDELLKGARAEMERLKQRRNGGVLTVIDGHTTTERKVRPQRRKPVKGAPAPVVILDRKRSGS